MNYYVAKDRFGNYDLCHYGVQGMRWGVRRFQDKNGRLTSAGKERYGQDNKGAKDPRAVNTKCYNRRRLDALIF